MKQLYSLLIFIFTSSYTSDEVLSKIKFLSKLHEFGNVNIDTPVTYKFKFTNIGDSNIILMDSRALDLSFTYEKKSRDSITYKSFSRIQSDWSTIKKDDSVCIIVTYTPKSEGMFYKVIKVSTSVGSLSLAIGGTVVVDEIYKRKMLAEKLKTTACDNIVRNVDEFTKEISYNASNLKNCSILKNINGNVKNYYLSLNTIGQSVVVDGTGVFILFTDGSKLSKTSVKIDVEVNKYGDGYIYSAFIRLYQQDITTLSTKKINKFRLYIFDQELEMVDSELIPLYFDCLKTLK